jgi:hypothetical protein
MSIINIVIFTIVSIFVLLLFFTPKPPKGVSPVVYPFYGTNPFFGAQIDDDEKLIDNNENKFNRDYEEKNKQISNLQKELTLCINNRNNLNNAIQKFRDEMITTATNKYNIKKKEVNECDVSRNSRIDKYISAYNKQFNKNITKQEVINKIAAGTLNVI